MPPIGFAGIWRGRMHYAWIVLAVMFSATLAGVGVRAAPGVMIVPLQRAFGWDVATVSGAISLNIILLGATGPFLTGLIEVIGLKRTILACMAMLIAGTGLSNLMTAPWQMFLTWGLMVGIGSGAGAMGMAAAIANRWFAKRNGLAMGLLTAANAAGQLIFLAATRDARAALWVAGGVCRGDAGRARDGAGRRDTSSGMAGEYWSWPLWRGCLPESDNASGQPVRGGHDGAVPGLAFVRFLAAGAEFCHLRPLDQRIDQHAPDCLIAYCADRGISEVAGAGILASLGVFSLIGATASGWMCDRFNPRILLFWYYGLRGLSLVIVPFTQFDVVSLSIFSIFYGLDWVATGPATFALTNQLFGRRDTPVIISWIFAAHQIGGALAAFGAGAVRSFTGDYLLAFMTSGLACLLASLLVLRVTRPAPAMAPAV